VFVVIDENEAAATTFGPGSLAPYLSLTLVAQGAYLPNHYGIGHSSLDNHIAMVSGQAPNPSTSGDCPSFADFPAPTSMDAAGQQNGQGCMYPANVPTLMSQLVGAGLTWRADEDGMGADARPTSLLNKHAL
jgi:phosphatidylinositol-3-phosphatase